MNIQGIRVALLLATICVSYGAILPNQKLNSLESTRHLALASEGHSYKATLNRFADPYADTSNCSNVLNAAYPGLIDEIKSYQGAADRIIQLLTTGEFQGKAYADLTKLVDKFPIRLSGFQNLEDSIDYMINEMTTLGLEVHTEEVPVPHWVRGHESAAMLEPHNKTIRLLGLGTSVGTPEGGITADVLVVKSYAELEAKKDQVAGKIVVYNQGWLGTYQSTNIYRTQGASRASQYGAVATLIQSVAPFSLDTPHTGAQSYWPNVTQIPTACITMEDADFMYRLQENGQTVRVHLRLEDYNLPFATSRNVIGKIGGAEKPFEYVAVSGHIDSWDLGQGAMDDAGGVMISVLAVAALKHLNLIPKRNLQAILWTSEEPGLWGVEGFAIQHKESLSNYSAVIESDDGTFLPRGLDFAGNWTAGCIVNEILQLTASINTNAYEKYDRVSSDITRLQSEGVPGLSLNNANDRYFWYHHTEADTITMMNSTELDLGAALFAVASYVLSDISVQLPRDPVAPSVHI